jgi:hypothetical protein
MYILFVQMERKEFSPPATFRRCSPHLHHQLQPNHYLQHHLVELECPDLLAPRTLCKLLLVEEAVLLLHREAVLLPLVRRRHQEMNPQPQQSL